jgi:hypothetical protein
MSTNNTESLGFKVLTMGREEFDARQPCNLRPMTLARLHAWIDSKTIDVRLKAELKKSSAAYPQQALGTWLKMYSRHLATAQNSLQDKPVAPKEFLVELGDEPEREIYEEENNVPFNDEFDAGFENPSKDQSRQPTIYPNVQDEGVSGSRLDSEHPGE